MCSYCPTSSSLRRSTAVMWNSWPISASLRIPRLFKTHGRARSRSGADTINRVFRSAGSLLSLFLFYVAILAMYAVLSACNSSRIETDGLESPPRLHFDTFPQAMLALFTVSTGEGWTELMFHDIQITKAAIPFYITFFILVNYIKLQSRHRPCSKIWNCATWKRRSCNRKSWSRGRCDA